MVTVEIKCYNKNHALVNSMVITAEAKDLPARLKMSEISARNRNQYIVTRIIK